MPTARLRPSWGVARARGAVAASRNEDSASRAARLSSVSDHYRAPGWFTLRATGTGELRVGRRAESFRGRELTDDEKVPVLRAYLKRWKAEVGIFFEGTGPDSSDDQIRAIAPKHPAFEVLPAQ